MLGIVPAHRIESIVLKSWPLHEADLVVSLFTREAGKIKGIAKSGAKSRRRFGGALEPMTHVLASYVEKPRQELVRLDACEIVTSPLSDPMDYARAAALAFYTEVLEEALPDHDPQEVIFRLVLSVLAHTRQGAIWMPVTYFALWMPRLLGWLPDLTHCAVCDEPLTGRAAFFHSEVDGLLCETHRRPGARILSAESLALAQQFFRKPVAAFAPTAELPPWPPARAADLRRFALITLERHLERRLHSADALRRLGG
ncbi:MULTISPECIES: DNA repair protein RecO [Acidobacterium]|uniref:DNA repair protein RecO n=1 Tax=Acidobacterium TaxID=33973 RepID=UPI0002F479F3|nr:MULTISPECIES: DNA repair protein RecO [Acidobacterium]HCT61386.1 DNA repair protein RecO [Acidobacterium sp.]